MPDANGKLQPRSLLRPPFLEKRQEVNPKIGDSDALLTKENQRANRQDFLGAKCQRQVAASLPAKPSNAKRPT